MTGTIDLGPTKGLLDGLGNALRGTLLEGEQIPVVALAAVSPDITTGRSIEEKRGCSKGAQPIAINFAMEMILGAVGRDHTHPAKSQKRSRDFLPNALRTASVVAYQLKREHSDRRPRKGQRRGCWRQTIANDCFLGPAKG